MEAEGAGVREEERLPPGFRFHPTDEELITYYLTHKITEANFGARAIADVDLTKCEPWDLPEKAKMGEKEWYFFSLRDRKYPTGVRTNRATTAGYWKTTGKDKEIFSSSGSSNNTSLVGLKKTLVFYKGRAPRGEKTNWVMHEYRLYPKSSAFTRNNKDEWVVCRVFMKSSSSAGASKKNPSNLLQRAANNPYYVDFGQYQTVMPSSIHNDPNFHVGAARSYPFPNAELMDLARCARGRHASNIPLFQPQLSSPGGGFSTSLTAGLNLNLGAASTPMPPPSLPQLRVMPAHMTQVADHPPPSSSAMANGVLMGSMDGGFSHHVDACMQQLEGYWSSF